MNPITEINDLFVDQDVKGQLLMDFERSPHIPLNKIDLQWLQVLSEGWATPLNGFMTEIQLLQCLHFGSICDNKNQWHSQSIPIVLAIDLDQKNILKNFNFAFLSFDNKVIGAIRNFEIFDHRKEERCCRQFGTNNINHPVVKLIYESGDYLIGGEVMVFERILWNDGLDVYRLKPIEIIEKMKQLKADAIYAFQLRNPIHNGHALLMKETRIELMNRGYKNPVLLLHPLGGWTKDDDVPLDVRIKQHEAVIKSGVLPADVTVMAIFPAPMVYAGPTEVQWHCKARMIAGAQYYIVGRDPAGIPHPDPPKRDLYDPTHGAKILSISRDLHKHIEIVPFKAAAYHIATKKMTIFDEKRANEFESISGTRMRTMARNNELPPIGFMEPEAWNILVNYYQSINE